MRRRKFRAWILLTLVCACSRSPIGAPSDASGEPGRWRRLNFPAAAWKHDDASFIDVDTGWVVVNSKGQIHKTEDGGESWKLQFEPPERPFFRCIGFADEKRGFACNLVAEEHDNPLYRTLDGGATWTMVPFDVKVKGLCGISVVNSETIYLTGRYPGPAYFVKSTDGGESWTVTDMSERLGRGVDIHFWNEREGLLLGGSAVAPAESRAVILATSDGGKTWTERYRGPRDGEWGWKLSFPSRQIGYASVDTEALQDVETEYFLKTEDGGRSWQRKPFYRGQYRAQGIGFVTPELGWIGSFLPDRPTLMTIDGGETWSEVGFGDRINRFRFVDGMGIAAGHWLYRFDPAPEHRSTGR